MLKNFSERLKKLFRNCVEYMGDQKKAEIYTSSVSYSFETGHITEYYAANREDDGWVIDRVIGGKKIRCPNIGGYTNLINTDRKTALAVIKNLEMSLRNFSEEELIAEINNKARSYPENHIISIIRQTDHNEAPAPSRSDRSGPTAPTPDT